MSDATVEWMKKACELQSQLSAALNDIQAYRGALGYPVPGDHNGKLIDGTTPVCGMCTSAYRRDLETTITTLCEALEKIKASAEELKVSIAYDVYKIANAALASVKGTSNG